VRYFFHVMSGDKAYKDEVGRDFASAGGARAHAGVVASELAEEDWSGFSVVVVDDHGHEIARVPIHRTC